MQQPRSMNGIERRAYLDGVRNNLRSRKRTRSPEDVFERFPVNELGPDSNLRPDLLGAVHRDDVWVPDPRQKPSLVYGKRCTLGGGACFNDFEGNLAIEPRVPGAVDVAKGAPSHAFLEAQVTPRA